jgi:hypothetical protein
MNFKKLIEDYSLKKTVVQLREKGSFGSVWLGVVRSVEDDFIEFKGIHPMEILETKPFRIRSHNQKYIDEWRQKIQAKARSFKIPFSNIASIEELKEYKELMFQNGVSQ